MIKNLEDLKSSFYILSINLGLADTMTIFIRTVFVSLRTVLIQNILKHYLFQINISFFFTDFVNNHAYKYGFIIQSMK